MIVIRDSLIFGASLRLTPRVRLGLRNERAFKIAPGDFVNPLRGL